MLVQSGLEPSISRTADYCSTNQANQAMVKIFHLASVQVSNLEVDMICEFIKKIK